MLGQTALLLISQEHNSSLADLAAAMQSEFREIVTRTADNESERRCAALLSYSITDSSARSLPSGSQSEDPILESGRVAIDITQSQWDAASFSPHSQECAYFAALTLLKKNEVSHVASLLRKPDALKGRQRAEVLERLAQASLRIGQEKVASEAVLSLRAFLEKDSDFGVDYDGHICLFAMMVSASLGDELHCRWFCDRLRINEANVNLLADFCAVELSETVLTHSAFSTIADVVKDLPAGKLREQLCTFILFHDRNASANEDAGRLLWLQPQLNVRCASVCRRLFLAQPLTQDEQDFLIADPVQLRTVVSWLAQQSVARGSNNFPSESARVLRKAAENCLPDGSAALWYIRSRLAVIGAGSDPVSSRECLGDWVKAFQKGAESDVVTAAATHMMRVAISMSDVKALHQILESWRTMREKMDHIERQISDAETLRILQALPDTLSVSEIPSDIRSAFPFAVGMIRLKDFPTARSTFRTPHERFWFTAGHLSSRLKEEGLITSVVIECCTATQAGAAE
jgi:hypothetical protein